MMHYPCTLDVKMKTVEKTKCTLRKIGKEGLHVIVPLLRELCHLRYCYQQLPYS